MTTLHCTEIKIKNKERNDNSLFRPYQGEQTPCEMFVLQSLQYLLLNERLLHTSGSFLVTLASSIRVCCLPIFYFCHKPAPKQKDKKKERKENVLCFLPCEGLWPQEENLSLSIFLSHSQFNL